VAGADYTDTFCHLPGMFYTMKLSPHGYIWVNFALCSVMQLWIIIPAFGRRD